MVLVKTDRIYYLLSTIYYLLSTIYYLLSTITGIIYGIMPNIIFIFKTFDLT